MTTKDSLHALIERLPEHTLPEAERLLASLTGDPFLQAMLNAPADDEPLTDEDIAAIEEGRLAKARGELIPLDEAWADLMEDE